MPYHGDHEYRHRRFESYFLHRGIKQDTNFNQRLPVRARMLEEPHLKIDRQLLDSDTKKMRYRDDWTYHWRWSAFIVGEPKAVEVPAISMEMARAVSATCFPSREIRFFPIRAAGPDVESAATI